MSEVITVGWSIGLAVMFMLTLLMTYATYKDLETFFIWLNIFAGFVVWAGLVDLWVLVITLIALVLIIIIKIRNGANT